MSLEETQAEQPETVVTETEQPAQETTPAAAEESDEQAHAEFVAGFESANSPEPEHETDAKPQPDIAGFTPEQIREAITRLNELAEDNEKLKTRERQLNGAIGNLMQGMKELKERPGHQPAKLSKESLKRLSNEYPDLAEALIEDLSEGLSVAAPSVDPSVIDERIKATTDEISRAVELRLLKRAHPDWREVVRSPEFQTFRKGWTADDNVTFNQTWDADFIDSKLTAFKAEMAKAKATSVSNEKNLKRAIVPKGVTTAVRSNPSDEDEFLSGFYGKRRA